MRFLRAGSIGIILLTAAAVAACSGGADGGNGPGSTTAPGSLPPASLSLGSCGTSTALFTVPPVALADVNGWVPLGNLAPPGHLFPTDHQYLYVNSPENPATIRQVTVVSPGAITITQAHRTHYSNSNTYDYAFTFYPCDDVRGEFGHVTTIAPAILDRMGAFDQQCDSYTLNTGVTFSNCYTRPITVKLAAGDTIGTTAGQGTSFALDFSLFDRRTPTILFANPSRWIADQSGLDHRHTVPASDYFAEPARSAIRARLGSFDGKRLRTVEPLGGTIAVDVPGTAQGVWINAAQPLYPEGSHLGLVPDNVDPSRLAVSMGTSQPGFSAGLYMVTPTSSGLVNRHPSQITNDGNVYCYEFGNSLGVLFVQLLDASTLRVEGRQVVTTCAAEQPWTFGPAAFTYVR
jgi:hypothetical protein